MSTIKLRRGDQNDLPAGGTQFGEPRFAADTGKLFIDNGTTNVEITPSTTNLDSPLSTLLANGASATRIALDGLYSGGGGGGSVSAANVASIIHNATNKATPGLSDELVITDSAASWAAKRLTVGNLKTFVLSSIVSSAPAILDTIDELAAALGNDGNFATSVANSIATRQPKTMTGTCATANGTAAKTVNLDNPWSSRTPAAGDCFLITFSNGSSAATPTLTINGGSAYPIRTPSGGTGVANLTFADTVQLYFDGAYFVTGGATQNTTYGEIAGVDITNAAGTTAGLVTGQRAEALMVNEAAKARTLTNKDLTSGTNTFPTFNQSTTGSAATLTTGRTIQTNLASTSAATFNGSTNVTPGVTGVLPVINGGTGAATLTGIVKASGISAFTAAVPGTDYVVPSGALGTPTSGTLTNCTGLPLSALVASTVTAVGVGTIELGHASDTTLSRNAAGVLAVEGVIVPTVSSTNTLTNKTLTTPVLTTPAINGYTEAIVSIGTVTTAATLSLASGTVLTATLTASTACTFTMPNHVGGKSQSFTLFLKQAVGTGGTATFTGVHWPYDFAPVSTVTASAVDAYTFVSDGTTWYGTFTLGFS